jgi:predicted NodU family carbamoyl transferase
VKVLGINISHDFSICIYENKQIKNLWYEERYNFKKWYEPDEKDTFFISLFKNINFKPDLVVYSCVQLNDTSILEKIILNIQTQLDNPPHYFNKHHHHIYHALSGFYFSKFNEAMCIIIDGNGSMPFDDLYQEIESIFYVNSKKIFKLYQHLTNKRFIKISSDIENYSNYTHKEYKNGVEYVFSSKASGGLAFNRACILAEMINGTNAGKLMGLSSYAYCKDKYTLDYNKVRIAKEVQEKTFNETCMLIEKAYDYKKIKNFVLSGGYFLNCSNNFKYVKKYPEINFFVDPIANDGGTSIGACIYNDYK